MKHLLVAVPRMIHPAMSGGEKRVAGLLMTLRGRWKVTVLTFLDPGEAHAQTAAALDFQARTGVEIRFAPRDGMAEALSAAVAAGGVDLVHLEFTQMAGYARALKPLVPVVATEHDASILSWGRSYVRPTKGSGALAAIKAALAMRRVYSSCDRVMVTTKEDADRLALLLPRKRLRVVPTGVSLEEFPFRGLEGRAPGSVVFVGHYLHYPNEDAALFLCRDIMPELRRLVPGAAATLVGSATTPAVRELASESVVVTGTVPRVAPYLERARVFIAPMRLGYGLKGKILEAFASGTPLVCTRAACEGVSGVVDGRHALFAETAADLAAAAARLMRDDALSTRLAAAAHELVKTHFSWSRQGEALDAVFREALEERRPV